MKVEDGMALCGVPMNNQGEPLDDEILALLAPPGDSMDLECVFESGDIFVTCNLM